MSKLISFRKERPINDKKLACLIEQAVKIELHSVEYDTGRPVLCFHIPHNSEKRQASIEPILLDSENMNLYASWKPDPKFYKPHIHSITTRNPYFDICVLGHEEECVMQDLSKWLNELAKISPKMVWPMGEYIDHLTRYQNNFVIGQMHLFAHQPSLAHGPA